MARPCFLVVDREYAGSISTRKLVIETAKLNVITAYSGAEALETMERFPAIDGVVLDAGIKDLACEDVVRQLKGRNTRMPVIVIGTPQAMPCNGADHYIESFDPGRFLALIKGVVPEAARVMDRESSESPT